MVLFADLQDGSRTVLMQDVGPSDSGLGRRNAKSAWCTEGIQRVHMKLGLPLYAYAYM